MDNKSLIIEPSVARAKADKMKLIALDLKDTLDIIANEIEKIATNNIQSDSIVYETRKANELREKLDSFKETFHLINEQVNKSANDIIEIANTAELQ